MTFLHNPIFLCSICWISVSQYQLAQGQFNPGQGLLDRSIKPIVADRSVRNEYVPGGNNSIYDFKPSSELRRRLPIHVLGFDWDGRPVWLFEIGKWNMTQRIREFEGKWDKVFLYLEQSAQFFADISLAPKKAPNGTLYGPRGSACIVDVGAQGGNVLAPGVVQFYTEVGGYVNRSFREISYVFIINLSRRHTYFYNFVIRPALPWLAQRTLAFGTDPEKYIPAILRMIPQDQLPEHLGGLPSFKYVAPYGQRFNYNMKF